MPRHVFLTTTADGSALRRLDQAIAAALPAISRRRARELIARGSVAIDGVRVRVQGRALRPGQRVEVHDDAFVTDTSLPAIAFDGGDVVVVDKPAGVACEPTRQAAASITDSFARAGRPLQAVHRLDVDTTGALLLARPDALAPWSRAFHDGAVVRVYVALVAGRMGAAAGPADEPGRAGVDAGDAGGPADRDGRVAGEDDGDDEAGEIDAPLLPPGRDGRARISAVGKPARTAWRVIARGDGADLLVVVPRTGRTHQIRAHLAWCGHALVGDHRYGVRLDGALHLGLHAVRLRCAPDGRDAVDVVVPPPASFVATAARFGLVLPAALDAIVADDRGADDRGADDRGDDDRGADDRIADDRGADDRGADDADSHDDGAPA
jgi:23S rRNA-/tRNA-specific pseudouridylate synthase